MSVRRRNPLWLLLGLLALLVGQCQRETPTRVTGDARLRLSLSWEQAASESARKDSSAASAASVGAAPSSNLTIRRIEAQIWRTEQGSAVLLGQSGADISPGQVSFTLDLTVPAGAKTLVAVTASGSLSGVARPPRDGILYFGQAGDLTVLAGQETAVPIVMSPFYAGGLRAGGTIFHGYRLDWDAVPGAVRYTVRRFEPGGDSTDTPTTATSAVFPPPGGKARVQRFLHRVRAENDYALGAWSDSVGVPTEVVPLPPSNLRLVRLPAGSIRLRWQDNSDNETGFAVGRRIEGGAWTVLVTTAAGDTLYLDPGPFPPGSRVSYQILALNEAGGSAPSDSAWVDLPPVSPANPVAVAVSADRIRCSWDRPLGLADSVWIERRVTAPGERFARVAGVAAEATVYTDRGLLPRTSYGYRFLSRRRGVSSAPDSAVAARTWPPAPQDLVVNAVSEDSVRLAWSYPPPAPDSIRIERRTPGGVGWSTILDLPGGRTRAADGALKPRTIYAYRLRAVDGGDLSDYAGPDSARTWPAPPSDLSAQETSRESVKLSWTYPAPAPEWTRIWRQDQTIQGAWRVLHELAGSPGTYEDSTVQVGQSYAYALSVLDRDSSRRSDPVEITVQLQPPAAPGSLTATPTSDVAVNLEWADNSSNESTFVIERRGPTSAYAQVGTVPADSASFQDTGLHPLTSYSYRVKAHNDAGDSPYSNEAGATTFDQPPVCDLHPASLDYGTVLVGQTQDKSFTITNIGGGVLSGPIVSRCGSFSIVSGGGAMNLTAGQSRQVIVRYQPPAPGTHHCTVLTGATCSSVVCTGAAPGCTIDPVALDFGSVPLGQFLDRTFTITNSGGGTLGGGVALVCSANFSLLGGGGPFSLAAGESHIVTVRYQPEGSGVHQCQVETGGMCAGVTCTGGSPACTVDPPMLNFGSVLLSSFYDLTCTVSNSGGGILTGDITVNCAPFQVIDGGGPFALGAGESRMVTVRYQPVSGTVDTCTLETGAGCTVDLEGAAPVCQFDFPSPDFGAVTAGFTKNTTAWVINMGAGTLSGWAALTPAPGDSCFRFDIIEGGGSFSLGPGQVQMFTIQFHPGWCFSTNTCHLTIQPVPEACGSGEGIPITGYADCPAKKEQPR